MPLLMCPNDNSSMQTVQRGGVEFDMCPSCRGVWLDRGELEKLIDGARVAFAADAPAPQPRPEPQRQQQSHSYGERGEQGERGEHGYSSSDPRRKKRGFDMFDIFD